MLVTPWIPLLATGVGIGYWIWPRISRETQSEIREKIIKPIGFICIIGILVFVGSVIGKKSYNYKTTWQGVLVNAILTELFIVSSAMGLGFLINLLHSSHYNWDMDEEIFVSTLVMSNLVFIPIVVSKVILAYTSNRNSAQTGGYLTLGLLPLVGIGILSIADYW